MSKAHAATPQQTYPIYEHDREGVSYTDEGRDIYRVDWDEERKMFCLYTDKHGAPDGFWLTPQSLLFTLCERMDVAMPKRIITAFLNREVAKL